MRTKLGGEVEMPFADAARCQRAVGKAEYQPEQRQLLRQRPEKVTETDFCTVTPETHPQQQCRTGQDLQQSQHNGPGGVHLAITL
ncbi:hypothetical protein D3C72_1284800 [compost metagenome]